MHILFIARHDLFTNAGGDTVQIKSTAKYLSKLGVTVDIKLSNAIIDYSVYDLIHFFNIIDPEDILGHVYKCNKPYVVSTIYVDYSEYDKLHRKGLIGFLSKIFSYATVEYFKTFAKYLLKNEPVSTFKFFFKGHKNSIEYILKNAAMLLPNSENEYKRLLHDFKIEKAYRVIPNAYDKEIFNPTGKQITRDNNLVLCVARIEGRKNQFNLIKAVAGTNIRLIIIGKESNNQKQYVWRCKDIATQNIIFILEISQEELMNYYLQAKVHVLPSWFETTGLSSLEAAALGCNIVVAKKGDVHDYFGDNAFYCEPNNVESIKMAIDKALQAQSNSELQKHIAENYTWEKAAEATLKAYKTVLKHD